MSGTHYARRGSEPTHHIFVPGPVSVSMALQMIHWWISSESTAAGCSLARAGLTNSYYFIETERTFLWVAGNAEQ